MIPHPPTNRCNEAIIKTLKPSNKTYDVLEKQLLYNDFNFVDYSDKLTPKIKCPKVTFKDSSNDDSTKSVDFKSTEKNGVSVKNFAEDHQKISNEDEEKNETAISRNEPKDGSTESSSDELKAKDRGEECVKNGTYLNGTSEEDDDFEDDEVDKWLEEETLTVPNIASMFKVWS